MYQVLLQTPPPDPVRVFVDTGADQNWWSDPAFLGLGISLLVVFITVWAGNHQAARDRAATRRTELATRYGEALADALAWCELPHRVARRTSDDPATLGQLTERFHQLHERLEYHQRWITLESKDVGAAYGELVACAKRESKDPIERAWRTSPLTDPTQMVQGFSRFNIDITGACTTFLAAAERRLDSLAPRWIRRQGA